VPGARARRRKLPVPEFVEDRDERQRAEERYRIYVYLPGSKDEHGLKVPGGRLVCIASTKRSVEDTLRVLRDEEQITNDSIVGIKDDVERKWLINPMAKGDRKEDAD